MYKAILVVCALLIQSAFSACCGNGAGVGYGRNGAGLGTNGLANGRGCGGVASTGGGFPITSSTFLSPIGLSVISENTYEGTLWVGGNLPFLGTVGIEGVVPTAGSGAVSYGCGNGAVGIVEEGPIVTGIAAPRSYGTGVDAIGGTGTAGIGYGANNGYVAGTGCGGIGYGASLGSCGCSRLH